MFLLLLLLLLLLPLLLLLLLLLLCTGMPIALVGHDVTQLGKRPPWPPDVSPALRHLVEWCWAQQPADR
jgi:hypothetical protein